MTPFVGTQTINGESPRARTWLVADNTTGKWRGPHGWCVGYMKRRRFKPCEAFKDRESAQSCADRWNNKPEYRQGEYT